MVDQPLQKRRLRFRQELRSEEATFTVEFWRKNPAEQSQPARPAAERKLGR